jgi:hypothetical protein
VNPVGVKATAQGEETPRWDFPTLGVAPVVAGWGSQVAGWPGSHLDGTISGKCEFTVQSPDGIVCFPRRLRPRRPSPPIFPEGPPGPFLIRARGSFGRVFLPPMAVNGRGSRSARLKARCVHCGSHQNLHLDGPHEPPERQRSSSAKPDSSARMPRPEAW